MSTKKSRFIILSLHFGKFPIGIVLPLRCAAEVIEGFADIMCLFRRICKKGWAGLSAAEAVVVLIKNYGPLDLADIDVTSPKARVKIKLLAR